MKLMIVDDHAGVREMIRQIAGSPGDLIRECASGEEAVALAGEFAPDWVTMDLQMPGIGGLNAARRIVALQPAATIVIVSAYDLPELRLAAAVAGAAGFVRKDSLFELQHRLKPAPIRTGGATRNFSSSET